MLNAKLYPVDEFPLFLKLGFCRFSLQKGVKLTSLLINSTSMITDALFVFQDAEAVFRVFSSYKLEDVGHVRGTAPTQNNTR